MRTEMILPTRRRTTTSQQHESRVRAFSFEIIDKTSIDIM